MPCSGCWPTAWSPGATSSRPDVTAAAGGSLACTDPLGPGRLVSALVALSPRADALSADCAGDGGRRAHLLPDVPGGLHPGLAAGGRTPGRGPGHATPP